MNIVIIPCFNRPAFLQVTLEEIQKAEGAENHLYIFAKDNGFNKDINPVISAFPYKHVQIEMPQHEFSKLTKQSRNVLNAYMAAAKQTDAELIYLIEDDIFIGRDFFKWHEAVHALEPALPCSIATRNNNTDFLTSEDANAYYLSTEGDYQSLGVCWKRTALLEFVYPFCTVSYFTRPREYVQKHWPNSKIGAAFCEQDGLIRRVIEAQNLAVAFPHVPRAFHGGFTGANRGLEMAVTPEKIRRIAFNINELKKVVKRPEFIKDSEPCDLTIHFNELKKVQCQKR